MTKMIVSLSVLLAAGAAQAGLTATQAYITKDSKNEYGIIYKAQTLEAFCRGVGVGIHFGSFEAARSAEALADGFYNCQGQFVRQPNAGLDLFKIDGCVVQDPAELTCP